MPTAYRRLAASICFALLLLWFVKPAAVRAEIPQAGEDDAALRQLLEKSLSITEIDKEIGRIGERRHATARQIAVLSDAIAAKQAEVDARREQAGRVIRAYYTGERDMLLAALLSFDSLQDLLAMLDYADALLGSDRRAIERYRTEYAELQAEQRKLAAEEKRLADIETSLIAQRERLVKLQAEVDSAIGQSGDEERLRLLIDEMIRYWETVGLHEVKRYFEALAGAMGELPAWLNDNKQLLEINGFTYTVRLPEAELNRFLREQNELFRNFSFRFEDGGIVVYGRREGMEVVISGHYTLEDDPNAIRFHTDKLLFNGLALPDTTRRALEEQFDLGFYPQMLVPFIRAESVATDGDELVITLKLGRG